MNIVIRKLIFNEEEIHLILWKDKPCFLVSELSKALDSVNKEDIPVFLRRGGNAIKGIDYDVVAGGDARELRSNLEASGIKKRFVQTMIIYMDGLRKYFNYRKTIEAKDFMNYLAKSKLSLDQAAVIPMVAEPAPEKTTLSVEAISEEIKPSCSKKAAAVSHTKPSTPEYSDLLKHLSFMEDFVSTFNKLHVAPENSIEFTKSMVKFLEENGLQAGKLLQEMKKWLI